MKKTKLMLGDNISSLKKLPDNSIDSVVTDPPYGLSFMNKKWDYDVASVEFWKEVYRVLKPGGHILSFGGTRTYHRMVVNIEDAGFEIRDQIMWIYGSGFPKSLNIGKAVDKLEGNERAVIGENKNHRKTTGLLELGFQDGKEKSFNTKGNSDWEGWGTALKPANEPICVARKPLSEKSVAENVLKWGTGGINVDGCRVGNEGGTMKVDIDKDSETLFEGGRHNKGKVAELNEGRFPANIILECICDEVIKGEKGEKRKSRKGGTNESDFSKAISPNPDYETEHYGDKGDIHTNADCPCYIMDEQSGVSKSSPNKWEGEANIFNDGDKKTTGHKKGIRIDTYSDKGGASRFFYQAKVSKAERNMGLDEFEEKETNQKGHGLDRICMNCGVSMLKPQDCKCQEPDWRPKPKKNNHPTVKPINLMAYLCRLITPPDGIVLDPYMGSGSTGISAQLEGFKFVGMEMDEDYFKIAESRIENFEKYRKFIK